jgi:hypothetical protein
MKKEEARKEIKDNLHDKTVALLSCLYDLEVEIIKSIKLDNDYDVFNTIFINEQTEMKAKLASIVKDVGEYYRRSIK